MTKDQIAAIVIVLGVLAGAVQQFYELRSEVSELRVRFEYVAGTIWRDKLGADWHPLEEEGK